MLCSVAKHIRQCSLSEIHFRRFAGAALSSLSFLPVETWKWSVANGRWWSKDVILPQEKVKLSVTCREFRWWEQVSPFTLPAIKEKRKEKKRNKEKPCKQHAFAMIFSLPIRGDSFLTGQGKRELAGESIWLQMVPHFWREHSVTVSSF